MRFVSDKQRRAVFANMNHFSQVNPTAMAAAEVGSAAYPPLIRSYFAKEPGHFPRPDYCKCNAGHQLVEVYDEKHNRYDWDCPICIERMRKAREGEFAVDPVKSYDVARTSAGVPFTFPVNTKKYYDGRIYVFTGEAFTLMKALEEMAPSMDMNDSTRAKVIAEDLGAEITKQRLAGKESDGMIFLSDPKLDFIERVFGGGEFSIDPKEAEEMAKQIKGWEEYDKESGIETNKKTKKDKEYEFTVSLDSKLKRLLDNPPKAKNDGLVKNEYAKDPHDDGSRLIVKNFIDVKQAKEMGLDTTNLEPFEFGMSTPDGSRMIRGYLVDKK